MKSSPFVIAELSGNHKGDLDRMFELILIAKKSGADAVKIQTYRPDLITIDSQDSIFRIQDPKSLWFGRTLYDLYQEGTTPWEWHSDLFNFAQRNDIEIFSTPFDLASVDFLESLNCPRYKIASFEITYKSLIEAVSRTGKPVIISTGMATLEEITDAVNWARSAGAQNITLLKCTSSYPAPIQDLNLVAMPVLGEKFGVDFGFSDHSLGSLAAIVAATLGASVIEKHLTVDRADGALDSKFSSDKSDFAEFVTSIRAAVESMGSAFFGTSPSEETSSAHRRSLFYSRNLPAGHEVGVDDFLVVRPNIGLLPKDLEKVVGMKIRKSVTIHQPAQWGDFIHD